MTDPTSPHDGGAPELSSGGPPEPETAAEPSPAERAAAALDGVDAAAALESMDPVALIELAATACGAARVNPDHTWLRRLVLLRGVLLMRNQRAAFAMVLGALAEVCGTLGETDRQLAELDTLVGVRDLLEQPEAAWRASVQLARAQAAAGQPDMAEETLQAAMKRARGLPPGHHPDEAAARMAETMRALSAVLAQQGRDEEAAIWEQGAEELDPA